MSDYLFFTPKRGPNGRNMLVYNNLKQCGYDVVSVGYGSPPFYVKAPLDHHAGIMAHIRHLDPSATFGPVRQDVIDEIESTE